MNNCIINKKNGLWYLDISNYKPELFFVNAHLLMAESSTTAFLDSISSEDTTSLNFIIDDSPMEKYTVKLSSVDTDFSLIPEEDLETYFEDLEDIGSFYKVEGPVNNTFPEKIWLPKAFDYYFNGILPDEIYMKLEV